jgi:hypothetical protein
LLDRFLRNLPSRLKTRKNCTASTLDFSAKFSTNNFLLTFQRSREKQKKERGGEKNLVHRQQKKQKELAALALKKTLGLRPTAEVSSLFLSLPASSHCSYGSQWFCNYNLAQEERGFRFSPPFPGLHMTTRVHESLRHSVSARSAKCTTKQNSEIARSKERQTQAKAQPGPPVPNNLPIQSRTGK